ncbi:N-acetylneuraminate synthase [Neomegalonema sp.]|uniref:N-acetylneuraminate synthase n=1 Tax=Neomegalonema sp. TaxID=2039713 RepID=UPI00263030ED|nr:N-acetylneuraminate synthase [Neomegalonema sp.]MDD2867472.1 N-acetylneuraminate synthase [Neomegalonema sp.]
MTSLKFGAREIGEDAPCYVIAEAGVNHNGDMDLALRLIDAAAEAGADAVKFQTFQVREIVSAEARKAAYQARNTGQDGGQMEMLRALELSFPQFEKLAAHCRDRDIAFMSTAFDAGSLDFVASLDPPALKWPSGEIDNIPFLRKAARLGRPVILSTGMAGLGEIERALRELDAGGCPGVVVLHCTSNYPAAAADLNLKAIPAIRQAFGRQVGYSDHSLGVAAALAARALGMCVLEKHYTLDRGMEGPDHAASLEPGELKRLIEELRFVEAALGDGVKSPRAAELNTRAVARRGLRLRRAMAAGEAVAEADLAALRPATGISPAMIDEVVGRRLARDLAEGEALNWADLS